MPALIVATFQATIVLGVGIWAYQIPFAGSLALFYFTMVIYGLSLVGFGLLISALCSTQQQAFIGVFVAATGHRGHNGLSGLCDV